jgi:protein-tyrosine sulfotransferase
MNIFLRFEHRLNESFYGVKILLFTYNIKVILIRLINFDFSLKVPISGNTKHTISSPFFIIGSGRSGNTLLRAMLNTHENIVIPPELYSLKKIIKTVLKQRHLPWDDLCVVANDIFFNTPHTDVWKIDKMDMLYELKNYNHSAQNVANLVLSFHKYYAKRFPDKKTLILGDKTPINSYSVWWINEIFPKAKYIHLHRDGRDVVLSYKKSKLYGSLIHAANRWNNSISMILKFQNKFQNKFQKTSKTHTCSYESLVLDTSTTVKNVCSFLETDFNENLVSSYQNQFEKMGDTTKFDHHKNVKKPVFASSVSKWKSLKETDLVKLQEVLPIMKKNLDLLNY